MKQAPRDFYRQVQAIRVPWTFGEFFIRFGWPIVLLIGITIGVWFTLWIGAPPKDPPLKPWYGDRAPACPSTGSALVPSAGSTWDMEPTHSAKTPPLETSR